MTAASVPQADPCARCAYAKVHHWWGADEHGHQIHHCRDCHRDWLGTSQAHCTQCHRHFSTPGAFDRHLRDKQVTVTTPKGYVVEDVRVICRDPGTIAKLELREDRFGPIWAFTGRRVASGIRWAASDPEDSNE